MKKVKLDNVYESPIPPSDIKVLWADRDEKTGDLRAIHRYGKNGWNPYLVSVDYIKPETVLPPGWDRAIRKNFQVTSYKTFVQEYNGTVYNVVGILSEDLIQSIGYIADFYSDGAAIASDENATITVIGDMTMTYEHPIRIVFTPNYTGAWVDHTTVNKPLKISVNEVSQY